MAENFKGAKKPTLNSIKSAKERIAPLIHKTPVLTSQSINEKVEAEVFFKCENFQKVGAFKFRGASNAIFSLANEEAKNGVIAHSSGNHAAALTLAAKSRGIKSFIVMPKTAAKPKIKAVEYYGGEIVFCEPTMESRQKTADEIIERTGARLIHPFDNYKVIEGQGTCALEFLEEKPELEILMAPIGGGGLISGTLIAAKSFAPNTKVIGAEPEGADDAYRSLQENKILPSVNPNTIADGLLTSLSEKTFDIIKEHINFIVTVSDQAIIEAMRMVWERMKIIIEPSSAVPIGALLEGKLDLKNKRIGVIISGGNVDLDTLPWIS